MTKKKKKSFNKKASITTLQKHYTIRQRQPTVSSLSSHKQKLWEGQEALGMYHTPPGAKDSEGGKEGAMAGVPSYLPSPPAVSPARPAAQSLLSRRLLWV